MNSLELEDGTGAGCLRHSTSILLWVRSRRIPDLDHRLLPDAGRLRGYYIRVASPPVCAGPKGRYVELSNLPFFRRIKSPPAVLFVLGLWTPREIFLRPRLEMSCKKLSFSEVKRTKLFPLSNFNERAYEKEARDNVFGGGPGWIQNVRPTQGAKTRVAWVYLAGGLWTETEWPSHEEGGVRRERLGGRAATGDETGGQGFLFFF